MRFRCRLSSVNSWVIVSVAQRLLTDMFTTASSVRLRGDDLPEHVVGGNAVRLGIEVENQAVPERGCRDGSHVVVGYVEPAFDQRADLRAEHDRLRPPRADAIANVATHHVWGFLVFGMGRQ